MSKLKKEKGFTLIELLVALAIVGIILLAFFKSIDSTTRINTKNDRDIKALNIAQSEIENLRNQIKNGEQVESENCVKRIDGKEFNIYLDISKEKVKNENKNNNIDTGLYLYTINIEVKSKDEYFSKKPTKLKNIKILSRNTNKN